MTLLEIEILIHYYCSPTDYRNHSDAPAIKEAINNFVKLGFLMPVKLGDEIDADYKANREAIKPLVDVLENLALPVLKWAMPANESNP